MQEIPLGSGPTAKVDDEDDEDPNELKLIVTRNFTAEQMNSMCNACHAKLSPISRSFVPGERFFDHFDLITLDHPDFYPDGRDLGENYTMTTWRMSPCVKAGELDCMHCHTSSGRYRFKNAENPNGACLPCHQERVENAAPHTHHQTDGEGSRCVACHMPMTGFARMMRSDHSMRPPAPAATVKFKSPNACTICHDDKDAAWADRYVRQWHEDDYQRPIIEQGTLVGAARRGDWHRLDDILAYIGSQQRDEIIAASLIRSLQGCESQKKWPVVIKALEADPSPLVRAVSAQVLDGYLTGESLRALVSYQTAIKLRPDFVPSYVNAAFVHNVQGHNDQAEAAFRQALALDPNNAAVHLNLGMLLGEMKRPREAQQFLRRALQSDPNSATAAYNLGVLISADQSEEGLQWCRKAHQLRPDDPRYAYTYAFYLVENRTNLPPAPHNNLVLVSCNLCHFCLQEHPRDTDGVWDSRGRPKCWIYGRFAGF